MEILTRTEFDDLLDEATRRFSGHLAARPAYPPFVSMARQLEAIRAWTTGGRIPPMAEKRRLTLAVLAARELEDQDEELASILGALQGYVVERMGDARAELGGLEAEALAKASERA